MQQQAFIASPEIPDPASLARECLQAASRSRKKLATAESCTGGLLSTLLSGVEDLSHNFDCGFVVYSDQAKSRLLGIPLSDIRHFGAVSEETVRAMARGVLKHSRADLALAISGYTGPAGPHENGRVHVAAADRGWHEEHREFHFGWVERQEGRRMAAIAALEFLKEKILAWEYGGL